LPSITVGPVLVTVDPARTAKLPAVPSDGACARAGDVGAAARPITVTIAARRCEGESAAISAQELFFDRRIAEMPDGRGRARTSPASTESIKVMSDPQRQR
jgi:hypothetical protein